MQKTSTTGKKIVSILLCILMLGGVFGTTAFAQDWIDTSWLYEYNQITAQKTYRVAGGVTERYIQFNNDAGDNQIKAYTLEVDLNNPNLSLIATTGEDANGWKRETVREQADKAEKNLGVNVVGGINGDMYNTSTGEPIGVLVMNGTQKHTGWEPFFAILNNGKAVIRDAGASTADVKEAVSGHLVLVRNGVVATADTGYLAPRTAIGIKADGTVVMFVADGRQAPASCGINNVNIAHTMKALGCVDALSLDGGGSATLISQRENETTYTTKNKPSYGVDRTLASSILVCSTAEPTGVYDHATFSESVYSVAPSNSVKLEVFGADINGFKTDLPKGGKIVLTDNSLGSLIGNTFRAKSKEGTVDVNYIINDEIVATTTIEISNDADDWLEKLIKSIQQLFANLQQFLELFVQKMDEKFGIKLPGA